MDCGRRLGSISRARRRHCWTRGDQRYGPAVAEAVAVLTAKGFHFAAVAADIRGRQSFRTIAIHRIPKLPRPEVGAFRKLYNIASILRSGTNQSSATST